jgi:glycosyltransferase involved in cell wall biosynthesis
MSSSSRTTGRREAARGSSSAAGVKVALVLWSSRLGGTETFTTELAGALRRGGVDARIVFVGNIGRLSERLKELEVPATCLGLTRGRHVLAHPRSLARLVEAAGADCAILPSSGYLAASLRAGGYRRPLAAVEHGGLLQVAKLPLGRRVLRRIDRTSGVWACDVEVAVSDYVLEELRKHRHARRLIRIRNGIDLDRFAPEADREAIHHPFTVGYAGRLIASKGVSGLVRAFASGELPGDSQLLIAGAGPEREALEALTHALGVTHRTHFLGRVDDMAGFWHKCDLCVVPSDGWIESFCLAAVEAMACGRPVVASRAGALPETIRDGLTGALVEPGDIDELARALGRYARDAALRSDHGASARRLCEEHYDIEVAADKYAELIVSLSRDRA